MVRHVFAQTVAAILLAVFNSQPTVVNRAGSVRRFHKHNFGMATKKSNPCAYD